MKIIIVNILLPSVDSSCGDYLEPLQSSFTSTQGLFSLLYPNLPPFPSVAVLFLSSSPHLTVQLERILGSVWNPIPMLSSFPGLLRSMTLSLFVCCCLDLLLHVHVMVEFVLHYFLWMVTVVRGSLLRCLLFKRILWYKDFLKDPQCWGWRASRPQLVPRKPPLSVWDWTWASNMPCRCPSPWWYKDNMLQCI